MGSLPDCLGLDQGCSPLNLDLVELETKNLKLWKLLSDLILSCLMDELTEKWVSQG